MYQSPQILDTHNKLIITVPLNYNHTDPLTGISMARRASTLFISEEGIPTEPNQSKTLTPFDTQLPTLQQMNEFTAIQSMIKICTDNAEDIKDKFLHINLTIPLTEKENHEKVNVYRLDFMKLKDRFMEFLKQDTKIKTLPQYGSNALMKPFRKSLNQFVLDRDIYTHGQLHFLKPNFEFAIEYINQKYLKEEFAIINKLILKSFNNFYIEINQLVNSFQNTRQVAVI